MNKFLCSECSLNAKESPSSFEVNCDKCGKYEISKRLVNSTQEIKAEEKPILAVMIRRYWERNQKTYRLKTNNYRDLIKEYDSIDLNQKISNVLEYFGSNWSLGERKQISPDNDKYIAPATRARELNFLLEHLVAKGYLECDRMNRYKVTVEGWNRIADDENIINKNWCFIAMTFTDEEVADDFEKYVKPVLEKYGFEAIIMKDVEHNQDIVFEILYYLKRSRFVIVDEREQKPNVYYEAGYAKGLGREVIFLCPEEELDNLQFDTRNLNHIVWKNKEELKDKLEKRIKGTILI